MKKSFIIAAIICFSLFALTLKYGWGATYYVIDLPATGCADNNAASATVDGTDYNEVDEDCNGGGTSSYYTTIADVNAAAATTEPGDIISFNKGGIWREQLTTPESGLTYSSHGTGDKPIISGFDIISGNWSGPDGNGEYTDDSVDTEPLIVSVDGILWTEGTVTSLGVTEWAWTSADGGTLFLGANPAALEVEAGTRNYGILSYHDNSTFSGLTLTGANGSTNAGIFLSSNPANIAINLCTVTKNAGYGVRLNQTGDTITISNNTITSNGAAGIGGLGSDNLSITINGNTISNNGWRTDLSLGLLSGIIMTLQSGSIYDNTISANGSGGTTGYEHGIYLLAASSGTGTVYDNSISGHTNGSGIRSRTSATLTNNFISQNEHGVQTSGNGDVNMVLTITGNLIANCDNDGIVQESSDAGTVSMVILNNTIYKCGGVTEDAIKISEDIDTLTIKNNILWATDTRRTINAVEQTGTVSINNNIHWRTDGDPDIYYNAAERTWATWQGYGFDTVGINDNPDMTDPANNLFTLTSASPAIQAGTDVSLTTDYNGAPVCGTPSIGAYDVCTDITSGSATITLGTGGSATLR